MRYSRDASGRTVVDHGLGARPVGGVAAAPDGGMGACFTGACPTAWPPWDPNQAPPYVGQQPACSGPAPAAPQGMGACFTGTCPTAWPGWDPNQAPPYVGQQPPCSGPAPMGAAFLTADLFQPFVVKLAPLPPALPPATLPPLPPALMCPSTHPVDQGANCCSCIPKPGWGEVLDKSSSYSDCKNRVASQCINLFGDLSESVRSNCADKGTAECWKKFGSSG